MNNIEQADGLPMPRRVISIITVSLGVTLAVMDGTIVNVALPSMAEALSISAADSIWIVNSYQLTIIMLLLAMARLTGQTSASATWCVTWKTYGSQSLSLRPVVPTSFVCRDQ